jgi:hypothetical protein
MAQGKVLIEGFLVDAFIYEGEKLAVEYPNGENVPIPLDRVFTVLLDRLLLSGEPCKIVPAKSPITRLDIVVLE